MTDALDDLVRMGIDIATDKGWTFVQFDHEPASTVLVAETAWWENDSWEWGARLSSFQPQLDAKSFVSQKQIHHAKRDFILPLSSRDELAGLFLGAAERVLEKYGEDGYRREWGGRLSFPTRAFQALETALACPAHPPMNYGG